MAPLEWDATWGPEPGAPGLRPPTDRTVLAAPATILREASPCGQIRARHSRRLRKVWVMEAVIATGGKQYRVAPGQVISIEKLPRETGSSIEFRSVVLGTRDGGGIAGPKAPTGARGSGAGAGQGRGREGRGG